MLFLLVVFASGCGSNKSESVGRDTIYVKTVDLSSSDSKGQLGITYEGTLEPTKTIDLSFQVSGTVINFPIKAGDYVAKGQLVASIDETIYRNQYNAQLAQVKIAEENYRRVLEVYKKGSIAEIKMLEAKSNYEQALAMSKATYQNIIHTKLYAPTNGYLGTKNIETGELANPGQPVAKLLDTRSFDLAVSVPEAEINSYKVGTPATIKFEAIGNTSYQGAVSEIGVLALANNANYNLKVSVLNPDHKLRPGMLGKVMMKDDSLASHSNLILLPVQSVQVDEAGNNFVYLVSDSSKAIIRPVVVDKLFSNGISIRSGLKGTERIIISGYQKITNHTPVRIQK